MEYASLLPLVAILLIFWLMVIRPASRRQKAVQRMQAGLTVGQRVMLASGIFGTIVRLSDDRVVIEIAPGVEVEAMRGAVSSIDEGASPRQSPDQAPGEGTDGSTSDA